MKEGGWVVHRDHSKLYGGEPEVRYTSFRATKIFTTATGYRVLLVRVARGIMDPGPHMGPRVLRENMSISRCHNQ